MIGKRVLLVLLLLNATWTFAMVVAPYTIPPGTVRGLDGAANVIDYWDAWKQLPWYAAITYAFGDLNCHQMESRSLILNGNQIPIDARMTAMFVAANLGFLAVLRIRTLPRARDEAMGLVPQAWRARLAMPRRRLAFLVALVLVGLVPTAIDGFAQLLTPYESTNPLRLATGALLGFFGALWLGLVLDSLLAPVPVFRASTPPERAEA